MLRRRATDARKGDILTGEDWADLCPASLCSSALTGESDIDLSVRISILDTQVRNYSSGLHQCGMHGLSLPEPPGQDTP